MIEADFLFVVSEIAAAFAGFATLVVVVAQRRGVRAATSAVRLFSMLRLSLMVILFGLVPYVPGHFGMPQDVAWRVASGLYAGLWLAYFVHGLRVMGPRAARRQASVVDRINFFGVETLGIAALALGSLGVWGTHVASVYLTALLAMLYVTGWLFLELVIDIARHEAGA